MYALPHQFPAVPLQSMGFLPVFLPSPVSSCSPSVIGVDARFTHQFPAVLLQSFGFLLVFFRGFQLLSFSHRRFHLKVLQSWGGCYQRSAIRFVDYWLLSDIILYFLFVAASSLRAISHKLFRRMHVKVIFRWWWLRSRQEVDYHGDVFIYCYPHFSSPECTHSFPHFLPVERGVGRHDNNRLSKAPSTSHTSHYLTRTVQANACEGDFPMLVIKVKTRSGLPHMEMCSYSHNVLLPPFQFAWMHTLLPTFFFACWKGRHDNNRLSKAPSKSHTSHYLTRTVSSECMWRWFSDAGD